MNCNNVWESGLSEVSSLDMPDLPNDLVAECEQMSAERKSGGNVFPEEWKLLQRHSNAS